MNLRYAVAIALVSVVAATAALPLPLAAPAAAQAAAAPAAPKPAAPPIVIDSPSAVLMDAASGQILYEKDAHVKRNPASVTKIMTLVLAFEALEQGRITLNEEVTASQYATSFGGTQIFLSPGEKFTMADMLKAIAVGSANDASMAVAEHIAGSEQAFVEMMNQKAAQLGMKNTHFANPHGLDHPDHYTTAYDLALLSRYATTKPDLLKLTGIYLDQIQGNRKKPFELANFNKLVRFYEGADGLKTGFTHQAMYTIAATAKRGNTRMIAVIMGADSAPDRNADASKLLNYGFANYTTVAVVQAGQGAGDPVRVHRGKTEMITAVPRQTLAVTVRKGQEKSLKEEIQMLPGIVAPVRAGQVLGQLIVKQDGKEVGRVDLVAPEDVPQASFFALTWRFLVGSLWPE